MEKVFKYGNLHHSHSNMLLFVTAHRKSERACPKNEKKTGDKICMQNTVTE